MLHYRATKHWQDGTVVEQVLHTSEDLLFWYAQVESLQEGEEVTISAMQMLCSGCQDREKTAQYGVTFVCSMPDWAGPRGYIPTRRRKARRSDEQTEPTH